MAQRNWAGVPAEILISITDYLAVPDKARFPAVCTSWLSAMKNFPSKSSSAHFPWLALIRTNRNVPLSFLNRTENQRRYHIPLNISDLLSCQSLSVRFRNGSQPGLHSVILFNPLTGAQLHLPSLSTLKKWDRNVITTYRIVLSASPSSTASFVAVVAIGRAGPHELAFARPGDHKWMPLHGLGTYKDGVGPGDLGIMDVVYHDDKFFAIFTHGLLLSFHLSGPSPQVSVLGMDGWRHSIRPSCKILVSAPSGELLQIRRRNYWKIFKFDRQTDGWVEASDFVGNWSIFLDERGSMLLSDVPGLEGNYIFFIDSEDSVSNVRAYDMQRQTVEPCFQFGSGFKHLIWFRPSLS